MVMSTRLMLSAVMRSGGYFRVTACTMDTGSTSICAEVPITTGTENSAKPMVMSCSTAAPSAGLRLGRVTRKRVCTGPHPETWAASSKAGSKDCSPLEIAR